MNERHLRGFLGNETDTQKIARLEREMRDLQTMNNILQQRVNKLEQVLDNIPSKDHNTDTMLNAFNVAEANGFI